MNKCNCNSTYMYIYTNDECIHINEYNKDIHLSPKCSNGHALIYVNGDIRKSHFRHKNSYDTNSGGMTDWHSEWQSNFPVTEKEYNIRDNQIRDRRADIVIEQHNIIIEIQHSEIDKENVKCRNDDYKLHNMDLIWMIDGNTKDIVIEELSNGTYLIQFNKRWKYKSFAGIYEYILLDIKNQIYKIPVNKVCNKMIVVKEWQPKNEVIANLLNDPVNIQTMWCDSNEVISKLILWQKGAGNGKTYGLWKEIIENQDKELFIVLSKTHSAKSVLLNELKDQQKREEYHIDENIDNYIESEQSRKYILTYTHKQSNRKVIVIIATIDSFYFNITTMDRNSNDPFSTLVDNFLNSTSKINKSTGSFKFAGQERKLNKKAQIWIDEAQDLPEKHLKGVVKLMLNTGCDVGIVGDKLQSLQYEDNIFTSLSDEGIPNINVERPTPDNNNRRIKVRGFSDEINNIIKFEKYNLPEISTNEEELDVCDEPLCILTLPCIISNETNLSNVDEYCRVIIKHIEIEVNEHNYLPENFLISSPVLAGRVELIELKSKLEKYWIKKFEDISYVSNISSEYWEDIVNDNKYIEYVQLHKSENGNAINLNESEHKTRIVSTLTSKGDGREVCIVLNNTEQFIKKISGNNKDLRYESALHVSLTRAKRKLYFHLTQNGDDIHKRFSDHDDVIFCPVIKHNININKLIDFIPDNIISTLFERNNIELGNIEDTNECNEPIEFNHHCVRYAVYKESIHLLLRDRTGQCYKKYKIIEDLCNQPVNLDPSKYWNILRKLKPINELSFFPLIEYSIKEGYKKHLNTITTSISSLKHKLENKSYNTLSAIDYIILSHMIDIECNRTFANFNINDLYTILDKLDKDNISENTDINIFYNKIKPIQDTCSSLLNYIDETYDTIEWNIEHNIYYEGKTDEFCITKHQIPFIGFNEKYVVSIIPKLSYNTLNEFTTLIEVLLERFLIYNASGNEREKNNATKYSGNKIITYILVLDTNEYKEIKWDWDNTTDDVRDIVKNALIEYFKSLHKEVYYFCNKVCTTWVTNDDRKDYDSPFKYIIGELKKKHDKIPHYIIKCIEYIETLYNDKYKKEEAQNIIKNEEYFLNKIEEYLDDSINDYFNCSSDDIEYEF